MKKVVKISMSVAMMMVAIVFFDGCSKDDTPSLVSGSFDGKITASVESGTSINYLNVAAAINNPRFNSEGKFFGNLIGKEVNYSNGSFTITLPTSGFNQYLTDVTDFFESFMSAGDKGKIKISDPSARILDVDFIGFYVDGAENLYVSGIFSYATSDKATTGMFVYVDSDVTVTGSANVSVSLKKGWNRLYVSSKLTTKAPDGMKWYFKYFD